MQERDRIASQGTNMPQGRWGLRQETAPNAMAAQWLMKAEGRDWRHARAGSDAPARNGQPNLKRRACRSSAGWIASGSEWWWRLWSWRRWDWWPRLKVYIYALGVAAAAAIIGLELISTTAAAAEAGV